MAEAAAPPSQPNRTILVSTIIGVAAALLAVLFVGPKIATKADVDAAVAKHLATSNHENLERRVTELEQHFARHIEVQEIDASWTRAALVLLLQHQGLTLPPPSTTRSAPSLRPPKPQPAPVPKR